MKLGNKYAVMAMCAALISASQVEAQTVLNIGNGVQITVQLGGGTGSATITNVVNLTGQDANDFHLTVTPYGESQPRPPFDFSTGSTGAGAMDLTAGNGGVLSYQGAPISFGSFSDSVIEPGTVWNAHWTWNGVNLPIPEPSTYMLILAGLGFIGVARRRLVG